MSKAIAVLGASRAPITRDEPAFRSSLAGPVVRQLRSTAGREVRPVLAVRAKASRRTKGAPASIPASPQNTSLVRST